MNKRNFMINLFTTLFILASFTDAQTAQRVDMNLFMKSCDKNADHRIDREEYQMYLSESFFFVDKDKDGYLVMDEVQIPVREMDHQKLANADKDNDGKLSIYEFCNAMHKDFEKADSNDDGTIDMGELESLMLETK